MARKFHPTQLQYISAKALYDTICEQRRVRFAELPHLGRHCSDEAMQARVNAEMAIDEELGWQLVVDALRQAERELIDWGKGIALGMASPALRVELEHMYDHLRWHQTIYEKVIDTTMRLQAR